MDTLSHALWPVAIFPKSRWRWLAALWGIIPDLGMFGPLFYLIATDGFRQLCWIVPGWQCSPTTPYFNIPEVYMLPYTLLHSFVPVIILAIGISLLRRKIYLPILGWMLHILLDMTMHNGQYATKLFYPFSDYHPPYLIDWQAPAVMLVNWLLLILLLIFGFWLRRRKQKIMPS